MKKLLINLFLVTLIMIPTKNFAADYETVHEFSAGDTLSADMMNELFKNMEKIFQTIDSSDLVGTWDCDHINANFGGDITGTSSDPDNLVKWRSGRLILSDDGDGTFSYTSSPYDLFLSSGHSGSGMNDASSGRWLVKNNMLIENRDENSTGLTFANLVMPHESKFMITDFYKRFTLKCDKQYLPPTTPATLTASVSGKTVSLAWTDSSTDETGFKVLRKDSLTGSYSTITTTSADATSYSDTVTDAKSYWYRVSATNSNGDSVASKMVKVDVE